MKYISKNQFKTLLLLFLLMVFFDCYEMIFKLIKSEAIFNDGKPQDLENTEGILAIIGYGALVSIAFLVFDAYLKNEWIFEYVRKSRFPSMDFVHFQEEPQFNIRDWTDFNKSCQAEVESLKNQLAKGEEKKEGFAAKKTILPTLYNSAVLEENEDSSSKINRANNRRTKLENGSQT